MKKRLRNASAQSTNSKTQINLQEELRDALGQMYDIERLISRISLGSVNGRDLHSLKDSLRLIPDVKAQLQNCSSALLVSLNDTLDPLPDLIALIEHGIHPNPPATIREGGVINDGYSEELDELRQIVGQGKDWIVAMQEEERKRSGIQSLKIGFNQVFGYYIDVTNPNLNMVPEHYIRKQTLRNSERFITPELKEQEAKVLNAEDRIGTLEYELFSQIREDVSKYTEVIQKIAAALAITDVLANFAYIASKYNYVKPTVAAVDEIVIRDGRHPVVEQLFTQEGFVPNDTILNCDDEQLHIITGTEHERQEHVSASDGTHRFDGTDWVFCACLRCEDRLGRPDFHTGRGIGQPRNGAEYFPR